MATDKRQFTLRMQPDNFEKIKYIAEIENRSIARQVEHAVLKYIADFETANGQILIPSTNYDE